MLALLLPAALATGLPPMKQLRVVDAGCAEVHEEVGPLRITYDLESGVCAPQGPCSRWVEEHLSPDVLVVWREDCEQPFDGRWVRDGRCEGRPAWRWTGRLDPGQPHAVGVDFQPASARVAVRGTPSGRACPAVSPRQDAVRTEVTRSPASSPQWIAMPAEGYAVVDSPEGARLAWTPGPRLRHWLPGAADGRAVSDAMPRAQAQAWLDGAKREPTGFAVRHTIVEHREWFEGWTQRGVQHCERVLEQDLEQRLRPAAEGGQESPPMRATMVIRDRAPAARCTPPR
jgi:hypothetical protein